MTPYRVQAYNSAKESDNKIHDDAVAARFGFSGGLVPGVDVYAYMTYPMVARWGRAWLERGTAECRFGKPVYEGEIVEVNMIADGNAYAIDVTSRGVVCATGRADLPVSAAANPDLGDDVAVADPRPPADEISLAAGTRLGMVPLQVTADYAANYLRDVRETHPLYVQEGLVHPGLILRTCNWVVDQNVVLGPWIHAGSKVQNLGLARLSQLTSNFGDFGSICTRN